MTSTPAAVERLTSAQARRIALAAQGFGDPRPTGRIDARHIRRVVERVAVLQLDSVNVFCRSHYLPVFARLGPYPRVLLDTLSAHHAGPVRRELVEYWAHMAALVPVELHHLFRFRMEAAHREAWTRRITEDPNLLDSIRELVRTQGPIRSGDTGFERPPARPGHMWNWHLGKDALEYLFWDGEVMAARRVNFERWYDLPERVLPPAALVPRPLSDVDQQRELVRIAARAMGVATEDDLGDYFRLGRTASKTRVSELVEAGELLPVAVDGWNQPAYLWPGTRRPRRVAARALLSPFDSLIWYRRRTKRLFGFHYRIEIYVPEPKRVYGYYVVPFLLGDALVARVDLKSDRARRVLRVQSAWAEPGVDRPHVAAELAAELFSAAGWLGLDAGVEVAGRGDLAAELAVAVRAFTADVGDPAVGSDVGSAVPGSHEVSR
ncbi:MAG: crosslink repair DNA glycosylase YcaQ family protein [bacterium]